MPGSESGTQRAPLSEPGTFWYPFVVNKLVLIVSLFVIGLWSEEAHVGAPMPRQASIEVHKNQIVLVGTIVAIEDKAQPELVPNYWGSNSDTNFGGAHDLHTIIYYRKLQVAVDEVLKDPNQLVSKEKNSRIFLLTYVYEWIGSDLPPEKVTKTFLESEKKLYVGRHKEVVKKDLQNLKDKKIIFFANRDLSDKSGDDSGAKVYEISYQTDLSELDDIKKALKK